MCMFKTRICWLIIWVLGFIKQDVRAAIGASFAPETVFPFMAYLTYDTVFICGAVILDKKHVLTAAQCIKKGTPKANYIVVSHTISVKWTRGVQSEILHIWVHPDFSVASDGLTHDDIAIITLRKSLKFDENAKSIIIAMENRIPRPKFIVTMLGWGVGVDSCVFKFSRVLKYLRMEMSDQVTCRNIAKPRWKLDHKHLCVEHGYKLKKITGASTGDIGSALVFEHRLVGIVIKPTTETHPDMPDIYMAVGYYNNFFNEIKLKESKSQGPTNEPTISGFIETTPSTSGVVKTGVKCTPTQYYCATNVILPASLQKQSTSNMNVRDQNSQQSQTHNVPPQLDHGQPHQSQSQQSQTHNVPPQLDHGQPHQSQSHIQPQQSQSNNVQPQPQHSHRPHLSQSTIDNSNVNLFCVAGQNIRSEANGNYRIVPEAYASIAKCVDEKESDLVNAVCRKIDDDAFVNFIIYGSVNGPENQIPSAQSGDPNTQQLEHDAETSMILQPQYAGVSYISSWKK